MKFTNTLLKSLSKQIETGNPICAIATANRYLKKDCPLRHALALKAKSSLQEVDVRAEKVLSGEIIEDQLLKELIDQTARSNKATRKFNVPRNFEHVTERIRQARRGPHSRLRILERRRFSCDFQRGLTTEHTKYSKGFGEEEVAFVVIR